MARSYENPKVVDDNGPGALGKGVIKTHPAYGTISANRISGSTDLFASNVQQHGYIAITINEAELHEDTYTENIFPRKEIMRVCLSEAQWVEFVSRMGISRGTGCTIERRQYGPTYEMVPGLPPTESALDRIFRGAQGMAEQLDRDTLAAVEKIKELTSTLPKAKQRELGWALEKLVSGTKNTVAFGKDQLTEHAEKLTTAAMVEINAMTRGVLTSLGVQSLNQLVDAGRKAEEENNNRLGNHESGVDG